MQYEGQVGFQQGPMPQNRCCEALQDMWEWRATATGEFVVANKGGKAHWIYWVPGRGRESY